MVDVPKILYIVVVDEEEKIDDGREAGAFRYTRPVLQSTLQLMGCKARHAFKISRRVFDVMRSEGKKGGFTHFGANVPFPDISVERSGKENNHEVLNKIMVQENMERSSIQFELYKRQTTVVVTREHFSSVVCDALSAYKYVGPNQSIDLLLACRSPCFLRPPVLYLQTLQLLFFFAASLVLPAVSSFSLPWFHPPAFIVSLL
ncbi:hypothetical protein KSP40_PGU014442 [Platanthera guangdongensis]|uniref:Chitin synthase n=1 Tax=Platanthera guangdongensis TaxID=2320717 RepID=A0ABR2M1S2_9ASPA